MAFAARQEVPSDEGQCSMTQQENTHQERVSEQQAYVHALRTQGTVPSDYIRPSFGNLEATIQLIEEVALKSNGNIRAIETTIMTLQKTNPALAALLEAHTTEPTGAVVIESESLVPPLPEGITFAPEVSQGVSPWLDLYEHYSREVSPEGIRRLSPCLWVVGPFHCRCPAGIRSAFQTDLHPPGYCLNGAYVIIRQDDDRQRSDHHFTACWTGFSAR